MTAGEIPEEAVEAAAQAIWNVPPIREGRCSWEQFDGQAKRGTDKLRAQARAAVAAALPHLRVQETAVCAGYCYSLTESGAGYVDPNCPKHPASHPRPVVDREALEDLFKRYGVTTTGIKSEFQFRREVATAVLALLPTEEGEGS